MADVFISYKREDRAAAQRLAQALGQLGFDVWWDFELLSGQAYRKVIREIITKCRAAVVLWSAKAVDSDFVVDEASFAKELGKLCPARIDGVALPFGFGGLHTDDLQGWTGQMGHEGFQRLLKAIETKVGREGVLGAQAPAQAEAARNELEAFKAAVLANSKAGLDAFLKAFPAGQFAAFAKAQMAELLGKGGAAQENPKPSPPPATPPSTTEGAAAPSGPPSTKRPGGDEGVAAPSGAPKRIPAWLIPSVVGGTVVALALWAGAQLIWPSTPLERSLDQTAEMVQETSALPFESSPDATNNGIALEAPPQLPLQLPSETAAANGSSPQNRTQATRRRLEAISDEWLGPRSNSDFLREVLQGCDIGPLQTLAEQGVTQAQVLLAAYHDQWVLCDQPRNQNESARLAQIAADTGDARALIMLSSFSHSDAERLRLARLSAEQGLPYAFFVIGLQYEHGRGVPTDLDQAIEYYCEAFRLGDFSAQHRLSNTGTSCPT